jgi:hypothetical protein
MRSHHTIKPNLLQCTRCQEEFDSQELLREHEKNVDCIIRCPDCAEEFEKKALRQTHQEATHMDRRSASIYLEIDEAKDQKIKESLKRYSDSLRKGKGPLDTEIEKWIEANTARYLIGRSAKDPRMELGQWYTIFTTLFSGTIVDHPCEFRSSFLATFSLTSSLRFRAAIFGSGCREYPFDQQRNDRC